MHLEKYNLNKAAYTPNELIDLGVVGSRTSLYRFVHEGTLKLTKQRSRTIFLAPDVAAFLSALQKAAQ